MEGRRIVGVVLQHLSARGLWQTRSPFCLAVLRLVEQVAVAFTWAINKSRLIIPCPDTCPCACPSIVAWGPGSASPGGAASPAVTCSYFITFFFP